MATLHLTLKKYWFDMIKSGQKRQEYREIKPYWDKRLVPDKYDKVKFVNGYGAHRPSITMKLRSITKGLGNVNWGAPLVDDVYILHLGEILEGENHVQA